MRELSAGHGRRKLTMSYGHGHSEARSECADARDRTIRREYAQISMHFA